MTPSPIVAANPYVLRFFICVVLLCCYGKLYPQPCTLPSKIFVPTPDEAISQGFGEVIDVDGDYMVAGAWGNSVEAVNGGIVYVFKLGADHQWKEIAQLRPSDPAKYTQFGRQVEISGNTIIVGGYEYNDAGFSRSKFYVFEKTVSGEWSSGTETYQISKPFSTVTAYYSIERYALLQDRMVALVYNGGISQAEVYERSSGIFSLVQTITVPADASGRVEYPSLSLAQNFFVIGNNQFTHADNTLGVAFVYARGSSSFGSTPAILRAADHNTAEYSMFANAITVTNSTIFVAGLYRTGSDYFQTFYIFEKPATGWVDAMVPYTLKHSPYLYDRFELAANENYLFATVGNYKSVVGFRKPVGGWSSSATRFVIDDLPADTYRFGTRVRLSGQHLVVACPARFLRSGRSDEFIVDYYSAIGFEDAASGYHQKIGRKVIDATDDFFGAKFAVHNDRLAVSAYGDDEKGSSAGVIYIFNTRSPASAPEQKIYSRDPDNDAGFGVSIAMNDSLLFIGAPYTDSLQSDGSIPIYSLGKVYVYKLTASGWLYTSQILPPNIRSEVQFGRTIAAIKGYVAITEFYSGSSESIGRVHIYKQNANGKFDYLASPRPSVSLRSDFFGKSIVFTDSMMVIGTGNSSPNTSYRLSAYVFMKKGEWASTTEDARLRASDGGWSDRFGASVSMYGQYIVVGAPYSPGLGFPRPPLVPGAVYIYKRPAGGWSGVLTETAKITPRDPTDVGTFGTSVVIDHDDLFIGSPNVFSQYNLSQNFTNHDGTLLPGKVYHFRMPAGGWVSTDQEYRQIQSFNPDIVDGYGETIIMDDRFLYVGAMLDDTESGLRTGSVQTMMQSPVIDPISASCADGSEIKLKAFPSRGTWSGPGINSAASTFNPVVAGAGTHTIRYSVYGCQTSTIAQVLSGELPILSSSATNHTKCIGQSVRLTLRTAESAQQYKWYFRAASGTTFSAVDSLKQELLVTAPGTYRVDVKRNVCPIHSTLFEVNDEPRVEISIDPLPAACDDTAISLTATPEAGTWSGEGVAGSSFDPSGRADGDYAINYKVVTARGCEWQQVATLTIDRLLEPAITASDGMLCGNTPVTLSVNNVDDRSTIAWYTDFGNTGATGDVLTATVAGEYFASVSKHSCTFETPRVTIQAANDTLFVPNIITANGDSHNDHFEIYGTGFDNFYMSVFNRHGKLVYQTNDPAFRWHPANLSCGVYYWRASYRDCLSNRKEQTGWVHLMN